MADEKTQKHTPGPWRAGRRDMMSIDARTGTPYKNIYADDPRGGIDHVTGEPLPLVIGRAIGESGDVTDEEIHANAAKMAAADEMLEALEKALPVIKETTENDAQAAIAYEMMAAIAKAKGEASRATCEKGKS